MKRLIALVLGTALVTTGPVAAGLFGKKDKANPKERVPALILKLKTDPDENEREAAAKELRDYDNQAFPEIVPVLMEALQKDPKASVRSEAACSLGKIRPISQEVGLALEQAASDASMRVRLQVRSSLWAYHFAGYKSSLKLEESTVAAPPEKGGFGSGRYLKMPFLKWNRSEPQLSTAAIPGETPAPPLAVPALAPTPVPPMPILPASRLVPAPTAPNLHQVPGSDEGPILRPPQ